MNEFKFDCPKCSQHILAEMDWKGRVTECPSCKARITIPSPPEAPKQNPPGMPTAPDSPPKSPGGSIRVGAPVKTPGRIAVPTPSPAPSPQPLPSEKPTAAAPEPKAAPEPATASQSERLRVATLTPAIKLEMIRAVRRRIADESSWLPGIVNGTNAYAAQAGDGETILENATSPEAVRFSLLGAFLLEFHLRQVVPTAPGRRKLLDEEIPEAIREVLLEGMSDEEREQAEDSLADKQLLSISHAQCLATLAVLEERYSQQMEQARAEKARKRLGNVRLADLVKKLEQKAPVAPEDVATALFHELVDVRRRLDRLEGRLGQGNERG